MPAVIGLPGSITACLFDLDGMLTGTAELHREAWKQTFDAFLREYQGEGFAEFTDADYARYVDGRPRADGARTFLAARGIKLPEGAPDDPPEAGTVHGLGNRKNALVLRCDYRHRGPSRKAGARLVPGRRPGARGGAGPHRGVRGRAVRGGGRPAGGFGFVVGVDRAEQADALPEEGADVMVCDLTELLEDRR